MPFPRVLSLKIHPRASLPLRLPARMESFQDGDEVDNRTPLAALSNLLFDCGCPNDTPPYPPRRFVAASRMLGTDAASFPTKADLRKILDDLTEVSSSEEPQHKIMAQSA